MPGYPSAVIFDLDGTLVDSAPAFLEALNRLFDELGRPPVALEQVRDMMGYGAAVLLEHALELAGRRAPKRGLDSLTRRMIDLFFERHLERSRVFPGVIPTLEALQAEGLRLGLCTNKPHDSAVETLAGLKLDRFFGAVVGGGEGPAGKPDGAHPLAVIERLGDSVTSAVMVGDTETDVLAARNAGLPVIAVSYGYSRVPAAELGADLVIDDFAELLFALKRLA